MPGATSSFRPASQQIVQHAPVVYQVIAGQQREVASSYRLDEGGAVRFALGEYDPSLPLVIDPVLSYSTYLGGRPERLRVGILPLTPRGTPM